MNASTSSVTARLRIVTEAPKSADPLEPSATDRQERIPGFDQETFSRISVLLIGAGGINGEVAEGLVRKGVGSLKIFDHDKVELSNLNRQRFFASDIGENKAFALARNLKAEATRRTTITSTASSFQDAFKIQEPGLACDVAVCGVDNNRTRIFVSQHFARIAVPVVILGVSTDGVHGYTFVQEPQGACFGCVFPNAVENRGEPCPNTAAIKDVLKLVAAYALYAVDSLVMPRPRRWNYKEDFLDGSPGRCFQLDRHPDCTLCGAPSRRQRAGKGRLAAKA